MKALLTVALALTSGLAFAKGTDLNCQITTKKGVTKTVHAKSETTCTKRKGKWVTATPSTATAAPTATTTAPAAPTPAPKK